MSLWSTLTGKLTREEFVSTILQRVRSVGTAAVYVPDEFAIRLGDDHLFFLGNRWAEFQQCTGRSQRRTFIDQVVALMGAGPPPPPPLTFAEAEPLLRPIVREIIYYESVRLQLQTKGRPFPLPATRPIAPHLVVGLVIDSPTAMADVAAAQLAQWGIGFEEALAIAKNNLGRLSHSQWPEILPGVLRAPFNDVYDATRIALPHVVDKLRVRGAVVAMALERNLLLVTGSEDEAGITALAAQAKEAESLPRAMSAFPLRWENGEWVSHEVSRESAAYASLAMLRYRWHIGNYEEQATWLRQIHGEDLFIATFKVMQTAAGELWSAATLTLDCHALLPRADQIVIPRVTASGSEIIARVPWEVGAKIANLTAEPNLYPLRFRTDGKLSAAQLAELTAAHLGPL